MKTFIISEEVLRGTIQYLGSKPYSEVAGLLSHLSNLEEVKEAEEKQIKPEVKNDK